MQYQLTTLALGEVSKEMRGSVFQMKTLRSAPHYFETSVPHQVLLEDRTLMIGGRNIVFSLRGYPPDILLIQTITNVADIFSSDVFDLEDVIYKKCHEILQEYGGAKKFSELYSIFQVSKYEGDADQFLTHAPMIASLLKSERIELDPKEIEYTLSTNFRYAKNDLAIIDWDGAFIFDNEGNFKQAIELLTLANVQLLRHRIVDRKLDEQLEQIATLLKMPPKRFSVFRYTNKEVSRHLSELLKHRMASFAAFQTTEREIKLIGDWYSARLYDLATHKFRIHEWKHHIKEKLDSVEDVYTAMVENFGLTRKDRAEFVQIIAFFVLQIGWFALIILEFFYFTR